MQMRMNVVEPFKYKIGGSGAREAEAIRRKG
jgi:hypothetical protein